jgi:hypothetical protein
MCSLQHVHQDKCSECAGLEAQLAAVADETKALAEIIVALSLDGEAALNAHRYADHFRPPFVSFHTPPPQRCLLWFVLEVMGSFQENPADGR